MPTPLLHARLSLFAALGLGSVCIPMVLAAPAADQLGGMCGTDGLTSVMALLEVQMRLGSLFGIVLQSIVMSVAMMLPLALLAIVDVVRHAPPRHWPVTVSFAATYLCCWLSVGIVMVPVSVIGSIVAKQPHALVVAVIAAIAWHSTTTVRSARLRCRYPHRYMRRRLLPVAEGGLAGLRLGRDCVLTCWPWMVLPMFAMGSHHIAMFIVALLLLIERARVDLLVKAPQPTGATAVC